MQSEFVTQLITDKPLVLVVGDQTSLQKNCVELFNKHGFEVRTTVNKENLETAYKIIWIITNQDTSDQEYKSNRSLLHPHQAKLTIIIPTITGVTGPSDDVYLPWMRTYQQTQALITDCNYYFTHTHFIFGQDIVITKGVRHPLTHLCSQLYQREIYDPEITVYLQTEESFFKSLESSIFRPNNPLNVLIQGMGVTTTEIVGIIKKRFEAYFQTSVVVIQNKLVEAASIPFSATTTTNQSSVQDAVSQIVLSQPAPPPKKNHTQSNTSQANILPPTPPVVITPTPPRSTPPIPAPQSPIQPPPLLEPVPQTNLIAAAPSPQMLKSDGVKPFRPRRVVRESEAEINPTDDLNQDADKKNARQSEITEQKDLLAASVKPIEVNQELERIFKSKRTEQKVDRVVTVAKKQHTFEHKSRRKKILFYSGLGCIGAGLGVLFLIVSFWVSQIWVNRTLINLLLEQSETGGVSASTTQALSRANKILQIQTRSYGAVVTLETISQAGVLVDLSEHILMMMQDAEELEKISAQVVSAVFGVGAGETTQLFQTLNSRAQSAYEHSSLIEASLEQLDKYTSEEQKQAVNEFKTSLSEFKKAMSVEQQIQPVLSELTGVEGRRTYAVLFQNEQELRPTGGFIQAVALLTFERGVLINSQTMSVYDIDQKLTGVVAPPEDLVATLGEKNWFLRDSNWDPDFPSSAARAAWFIENSLGTKIDGVFAINAHVLQSLLKDLGPLDLPEFNEVITERNIFERLEFHSEAILVSNTNTKDYATTLLHAFIRKITNLPLDKNPILLRTLQAEFTQNQALFSPLVGNAIEAMATLGFDGRLVTPNCPTRFSIADCLVTSVMQVETNVGVNKANYYIRRSISHVVDIGTDAIQHNRQVVIENTAHSNAWPKGAYKAYMRFYLDENTEVGDITFNGDVIPKNQVTISSEHDKKVVGFIITVPIQETRVLNVAFSTPRSESSRFSFVLFNQEQPGFGDTPLELIIKAGGLSPTLIAPSPETTGAEITFKKTQPGHKLFGVSF